MNTPYRLLVTGPRECSNPQLVRQTLMREWVACGKHRTFIVMHGACPTGVDSIAQEWALERTEFGVVNDPHPANWYPNGFFDRGAGPRRNAEMVHVGASKAVAFLGPCTSPRCRITIPHDSHGTANCAKLARHAGIHVEPIRL